MGLVDGKIADFGATEGGEVGAGLEVGADVGGEGANVGAGADVGGDFELGVGVGVEGDGVNVDFAEREFDCLAFAGEVVGALTVDFDGAENGRALEGIAEELVKDFLDFWLSGFFVGSLGDFAFWVAGGGGLA